VKAVLFDLDDTLYPERLYVHSGFRAVASFLAPRLGRTADELSARLQILHERDGRGQLFDTLISESVVPDPDRTLALACVITYRTHRPQLDPFPGVESTLRRLHAGGLRLGLVSDGLASIQRCKLAALPSVTALLEVVVLTDELGEQHAKPSPSPFRVACELLSVAPAEAAYVGNDLRKDFAGARRAGLHTIRVGQPPDEGGGSMARAPFLEDADTVADPFEALSAVLGMAEASRQG
jgi:putative hydrolase of the HAD superfamily